jgi:imidazolonepropionase-like amidohydrolase
MAREAERWIVGAVVDGARAPALRVVAGRLAGRAAEPPPGARVLDAEGHWLSPCAVDAHVHLAFAAGLGAKDASEGARTAAALGRLARQLLLGGVAGVLDLGAPEPLLGALQRLAPLTVATSGPLLCAAEGYPTRSWGADGYGLELGDPGLAAGAVERLHRAGARMVKLSLDRRFPLLSPRAARAAAERAHALGLQVAAHALDRAAVAAALEAGADLLAHTPVEPLDDQLIRAVGARRLFVTSTLHAFGGTAAALENLARLRSAGARVLYGTDLGNQGTAPGLLEPELRLLGQLLGPAELLAACTREPARLLGAPLGSLDDGAHAHLLLLADDPLRDPLALCRPARVLIGGEELPAERPGL